MEEEYAVQPEAPLGLSDVILDTLLAQMASDLKAYVTQGGRSSDFLRVYTQALSSSTSFKELTRDMEIKQGQSQNRHALSCLTLGFYMGWRARSVVRELNIMDVLFGEEE